MTDEELKELVAETSRQVRDLRTSQAQSERVLSERASDLQEKLSGQSRDLRVELSEQSRELQVELSGQARDLRQEMIELARDRQASLAETERILSEQSRELREELRDLARSQKRTDKQLGELGNRLGGFTEGLALPSVRELLYERFGVDAVVTDARARRNGHSLQIDAVGIANGDGEDLSRRDQEPPARGRFAADPEAPRELW